jgi:uncharacterized protein YecT (DUF1311 family)
MHIKPASTTPRPLSYWMPFITVVWLTSFSVPAGNSGERVECGKKRTTIDKVECLKNEMDAADQRLQKTHEALVRLLKSSRRTSAAMELENKHREWKDDRKKSCDAESEPVQGGTAAPIYFGICYVRMTNEREIEERAQYKAPRAKR